MSSDFVQKTLSFHCSSSLLSQSRMGNINNACKLSNFSKSSVHVFVTAKAEELDALVTSVPGGGHATWKDKAALPKDTKSFRVPASQTHDVPWLEGHFLSVFLEDEDDVSVCGKLIVRNMELSVPVTVLLYDV